MNKLIKNLTQPQLLALLSSASTHQQQQAPTEEAGRGIQLDGGIKIPMEATQRMIGNEQMANGITLMNADTSRIANGSV